jgi:DNA-binding NarL/FixJ family response regulator
VKDIEALRHSIRVLVCDSSPITSQLIAEAIAKDPRLDVVGFSSDPIEIFHRFVSDPPHVLLISARLREEQNEGLALLTELMAEHPGFKAVVLIDSRRPETVLGAFRAGASGVFCRTAPLALLSKCAVAVHQGQVWANSEELGFVLATLSGRGRVQLTKSEQMQRLSKREREVVEQLAEGLTNRQIAESLRISPHTVKNYIFSVYEKLGVSNRVELALCAVKHPSDKADLEKSRTEAGSTQKKPSSSAALVAMPSPTTAGGGDPVDIRAFSTRQLDHRVGLASRAGTYAHRDSHDI